MQPFQLLADGLRLQWAEQRREKQCKRIVQSVSRLVELHAERRNTSRLTSTVGHHARVALRGPSPNRTRCILVVHRLPRPVLVSKSVWSTYLWKLILKDDEGDEFHVSSQSNSFRNHTSQLGASGLYNSTRWMAAFNGDFDSFHTADVAYAEPIVHGVSFIVIDLTSALDQPLVTRLPQHRTLSRMLGTLTHSILRRAANYMWNPMQPRSPLTEVRNETNAQSDVASLEIEFLRSLFLYINVSFESMLIVSQPHSRGGLIAPRRSGHRDRDEQQYSFDIMIDVLLNDETTSKPRVASKWSVDSLTKIKKEDIRDSKLAASVCVICQDGLLDGQDACEAYITQMPCQHHFHEQCLLFWLKRSYKCPMCRHELEVEG